MLNFIKDLFSGIGITGGQAILAILLPVFLGIIFNPEKAYKLISGFLCGIVATVNIFLLGKFGKAVANIIEKFFIKVLIYCLFLPFLDAIETLRKDNKVTLKDLVKKAKEAVLKLIIK